MHEGKDSRQYISPFMRDTKSSSRMVTQDRASEYELQLFMPYSLQTLSIKGQANQKA